METSEVPTPSASTSFEVRRVKTRQELQAAMDLRFEVFCREQGVPRSEERDGRDYDAIHLIAIEGGQLLGTCRLVVAGNTVQLSRLAVVQTARRRGVARALLQAADTETTAAGAYRLVLHAQVYAKPLYDQAGYVPHGREFTEAGIRHVAMEKVLPFERSFSGYRRRR